MLGAPGTGRTTALLSLAARRLREGLPADRLLVLTPSRAAAARARDTLTATAATTPAAHNAPRRSTPNDPSAPAVASASDTRR